jgi:membrane associated rhomboid family serine protease
MRSLTLGPILTTFLLLALVLGGAALARFYPEMESLGPLIAMLMLLVFFAPSVFHIKLAPRGVTTAMITEDAVHLPRAIDRPKLDEVLLRDVTALLMRGDQKDGFILVSSARRNYFLPVASFLEEGSAKAFHEEMRERISLLPQGRVQLAEIDRRNEGMHRALRSRCVASHVFLALLGGIFLLERAGGAFEFPLNLIRFGASSQVLVLDGQWYRLLSASFLHVNEEHLVMNALAIFSLGFALERLVGAARLTTIYLFSALTGALASMLFMQGATSVGASTAVFGLLGAFAFVQFRFPTLIPSGFQQPAYIWVFIFGVNAVLPLFIPQIDWMAHVGGLAGGVLATYVLTLESKQLPLPRANTVVRFVAGMFIVTFAAGLTRAAERYQTNDRQDEFRVAADIRDPFARAMALNFIAWNEAIDETATSANLQLAKRAAETALESTNVMELQLQIRDTLATVHYRLGEYDRAIAIQADVLEDTQTDFSATQLARFMLARQRREKEPLDLGGEETKYLVARSGGRLLGLVRLRAEDGGSVDPEGFYQEEVGLELGAISGSTSSSRAFRADPEALKLP